MSFDHSAHDRLMNYLDQKGEDWAYRLRGRRKRTPNSGLQTEEPPMLHDSVSVDAFNKVVCRKEESLNDLLAAFNAALSAAGIEARYTQLNEDYAAWQADNETQVEQAREFHAELTTCLSPNDVSNLIRRYRGSAGPG